MPGVITDRRQGITAAAAVKVPCKVATTGNITLSGEQTIDGVSCVTNDRVLVKSQTNAVQNGVYIVSTGTWNRAPDWDGSLDVVQGTLTPVNNGTVHSDTIWRVTTSNPVSIGTSSITFEQAAFSDAQSVSFNQAGTGVVQRTVQDKLRDVVSVKDFGAVGDGVTDDTAAIQAALSHVNSVGGGVVFIPPGRFRFAATPNSTLIMYSNTALRGVGDASVIFFDDKDTVARSDNDLLSASNTSNIAFENFKIDGTALTYTNETHQKQCLTGSNIDGLRMVNVTIEKVRYMATAFSYVKNGYFAGNRLDYVVRDGLRCTNSENVVVTGNVLRRVADDCIALHALDAATVPGSGFVVTNNVIEASQGMKLLGAKTVTIKGNTIRRSLRSPVYVAAAGGGTEGNTPAFAIDVSGNVIADTLSDRGTNYNILIKFGLARSKGGLANQPGVNAAPYAYNYLNDIDTGTPVIIGQWGVRVCDNTIARTLPDGMNYSAWGYGQMWDRTISGFIGDPAITSSSFAAHGIQTYAPTSGLLISGNSISGIGTGLNAIVLSITGSDNIQDYANTLITNNLIFDCPGVGIGCSTLGSGSGAKQVIIHNNVFDLDPFFRNSTHNADNTWSSTVSCVSISVANTIGWYAGGNVFKNCGQTGLVGTVTSESHHNIVFADFVANGDNAGNKGVRQLPAARLNIIVPIDGDPTSATFGQIQNAVATRSAAIPTSGRYVYGHFVAKDGAALAGSPGSQYIVFGWWRATTGSGHVLNTDWFECRTLTGT